MIWGRFENNARSGFENKRVAERWALRISPNELLGSDRGKLGFFRKTKGPVVAM